MKRTIALVGPGRVGQTLARALQRRGFRITVVAGRSARKSRAAIRFIGGGKPLPGIRPDLLEADLLLLAVPDGGIASSSKELSRLRGKGVSWRGKVVLHTSGSRSSRELEPLRRLGAHSGSLHPLFPFPRPLRRFPRGVFFGVEGDRSAVEEAKRLARALGGRPIRIAVKNKVLYHASGTLVAAHLSTLLDLGARVVSKAGVPRREAVRALEPLFASTVANFLQFGPRSWTGPLARGDADTVRQHLKALRRLPPIYAEVYRVLGRAALELYRPGGSAQNLTKLRQLLSR